MVVKRESAKRYGMWSKLSTENSDIMFNSSHSYPLSSEEYIENVKRIVDNETPKIMYAEIRPSNYCNHGCDGCFSAELRKKNKTQLSKEALNKVIQDLSDLDTRAIRFSGGGEPLTHPNIEEAIEKAASNQMGVTLITNGKLLEDVDQGKLVNNINLIRISVNGGKNSHQKVHNTITDEYLGIVKSINDIANLRSKENKEDDLYIGVTYLVNPANIKDIYATTQDLIQSGINGLFFRVLNEHKGFSKKDKSKLIEQIELTNNLESGVFIHFAERLTEPTANPNINKTKCYSGLMRLYIEATGNVSICGRWSGSNRYQLGNINNQSIKDIIADNHVIDEIKNKNKMTCDNCDCVYFNKAMVFVEENYKKNNRIEFLEK